MQTTVPCKPQEEIKTSPNLHLTRWLKESRDAQVETFEQYVEFLADAEMERYAQSLGIRHPLEIEEEGVDAGWLK